MRCAHDDAIFVGQFGIQRIVFVERIVPHGRPEIICLQPQEQLEDLLVKFVIVAADILALTQPVRARRLVIEKDAAIFHGRRALDICAGLHEERILVADGHIRPPIPRRNADLLREIVDAVNGPALVAARNHQRGGNPRQRIFNYLQNKRFPFSAIAETSSLWLSTS